MSAFGSRLVAQYPKTPVALCDGHGIFLVAASGQILMAADMTAGSTGRRADSGPAAGARAGQEGLLAMVMTAGAIRVTVSLRPARAKVPGDFDVRERCRFRSMTVRYFPIALVSAV